MISIKNLHLNPLGVHFLYQKNVLYGTKVDKPLAVTNNLFLGNNEKQITVVVNDADHKHISETELEFVTNILTACKLSIADIAIVNMHNGAINWTTLKEQTKATTLLLFGVDPINFGMPILFEKYHVQNYDGTVCLYSNDLANIATDKDNKAKLWKALQQIFLKK